MKKLRFTVPVPSSSKNSRQLVRTKSGGIRSLPGRLARRSTQSVRGAAVRAAVEMMGDLLGTVFGEDDDIAVAIEHDVQLGTVTVEVWSAGPKPKPPTGRGRDIDNFATTILDAMNGVVYGDDRQVSQLEVRRV